MKRLTSNDVYFNSKIKVYSDGSENTVVCRHAIFKSKFDVSEEHEKLIDTKYQIQSEHAQNIIDYLNARQLEDYNEFYERRLENRKLIKKSSVNTFNDVRSDSLKRAKDSIFDYILNNDFKYFFTGTIDPNKIDSNDPKLLLKPVLKWLENMVKRYSLSYILVAERHKSGRIHFHGLFKSDTLKLIDSGTKLYKGYSKPIKNEIAIQKGLDIFCGRIVYNLVNWRFGYSTCIKCYGNKTNLAYYVTKYITKDCKKIFGKFFWHSRNLKKPLLRYDNLDYDEIDSFEFNGFKYIFKGGKDN